MAISLTSEAAEHVGRQLQSNRAKPANQASIEDLTIRLMQMNPLQL